MLRRTTTSLKVSPYLLYLKDLSKAGKLKGLRLPGKQISKQYRRLPPAEKAALVKRAQATTFPASEAYSRLAKREMHRKDVPIKERYAQLKKKWTAAKNAQGKPKEKVAAASKPKSAKSKVKKAGKKAKKLNRNLRN